MNIHVKGKEIITPAFFPDATRAVLKAIDSVDMKNAGVEGIIVNTIHLMLHPGIEVLKQSGGVQKFMSWNGHVISDSGGFQVLSLIRKHKELGWVNDKGVYLTFPGFPKQRLTPERAIEIQFDIGSDIIICLDDHPRMGATYEETEISVMRTVKWAKRCKEEYLRQVEVREISDSQRPLLYGVIQGGTFPDLRKRCAELLLPIGFDGIGLGGWSSNQEGMVDMNIVQLVSEIIPRNTPIYGLGVGLPHEIAASIKLGYSIFDCVLPTRDARHKRLYVFNSDPKKTINFETKDFYSFLYISKGQYSQDQTPISEFCTCYTCQNYTKAYLHHLFKIEDTLAYRLATIHNLKMYSDLMLRLRDVYNQDIIAI